MTADLVAFLAVHVYATAHLTKIGVLEFCLGGPASELGLGGKTLSVDVNPYNGSVRYAMVWYATVPTSYDMVPYGMV